MTTELEQQHYRLSYNLRLNSTWHAREQAAYPFHHRIAKLLAEGIPPKDLEKLVFEWPHRSVNDPARVAYTLNEQKGLADIQTVTSLGKYLRRHFDTEQLADHMIRDITACAASETEECGFVHNIDEMIQVVQNGPTSCMKDPNWDEVDHPYRVYLPEFGWHMAYRKEGDGQIWGRCLCLDNGEEKGFVRSYKRCPQEGYSHSDEKLEGWLEDQGYEKLHSWPEGTKLALIEEDGRVVAPYVDGDIQRAEQYSDCLKLYSYGELDLTATGGTAESQYDYECQDCGAGINTDDGEHIWVGRHEDGIVCGSCANDYTYVRGRNGYSYYVEEHNAICTVEGDDYDEDYLEDNGIVELANGDYTHRENAVWATDDEWYHEDDIDNTIVYICSQVNHSHYAPIEDTWECAVSGNIYHDDTEWVENEDGDRVHPDYYEEPEEEEDEVSQAA